MNVECGESFLWTLLPGQRGSGCRWSIPQRLPCRIRQNGRWLSGRQTRLGLNRGSSLASSRSTSSNGAIRDWLRRQQPIAHRASKGLCGAHIPRRTPPPRLSNRCRRLLEVSTTEIGRLANSDVSPAPTVRSARRKVPCPTALNRLRAKAYHRGAAYVARAEKRRGRCRNRLLVRLA